MRVHRATRETVAKLVTKLDRDGERLISVVADGGSLLLFTEQRPDDTGSAWAPSRETRA